MRGSSEDRGREADLCKKIMDMQGRLNITDEHMARLLGVTMEEWGRIVSLAKSVDK